MSSPSRVRAALVDHSLPIPRPGSDVSERSSAGSQRQSDGTGEVDSAPYPPALADAEIVGLGEATHGTRECFRHKARLIQWLVADCGFRTVGFEAGAAAATALDAFVRADPVDDAPDSPESSLAELDMWQWQTESVRDLLTWLRRFNRGRPAEEQVRVHGVDLSAPSTPAAPLGSYFERVDPDTTGSDAFRAVSNTTVPDDEAERERTLDDVAAAAATLTDRVEANREAYQRRSSPEAWRRARHFCRVIEQATEWARVRHQQPGPHPEGMAARDRFMAENALWALERDSGSGVALWAHDSHVGRGTFDDGTVWADATAMGERLSAELGDGYRPVGVDFGQGSFRAVGAESGDLGTFSVGEPAERSATAAFAGVDDAPFLLDLDAAATDERLSDWLGEPRRTRCVGSVFDPTADEGVGYARTDLPATFDYLLFLPESTPTRATGEP
ncbi:erythromycin esterase family protein [Halolamina litorea]|uniref:Erythromycin esterase family protein n=1 Tax=Halolamina litorea TaxID=1515593 RepID=A0ABD6BS81_9EURY|nr:erythromycin esterase family protein [Halolamina litorea]